MKIVKTCDIPNRCECGFRYVKGLAENEECHRQLHDEYLNGPEISAVGELTSFASIEKSRLIVVDSKIPINIRRELAKVARVAQRESPEFRAGYDGASTEATDRLFVVAINNRVIAMAITSQDDRYWRLRWRASGGVELVDQNPVEGLRAKIGRVWVARAHRRKNIGSRLLNHVAQSLDTTLSEIGWELPLTSNGRDMMSKLLPGEWLGRGDAYDLRATLEDR